MNGKIVMAAAIMLSVGVAVADAKSPVDYVNTGIGSISHLLVPTFRTVQRPNAMFRFNAADGQFTEDRIRSLWIQNPGHRDQPVFSFRPYCGDESGILNGGWFSTWDQTHAKPYRYDVYLDTYGVKVSVAPGEKTGVFAFDFEKDGKHAISFGCKDKSGCYAVNGKIMEGTDVFYSRRDCNAKVYLHAEFDVEPSSVCVAGDRTVLFFGDKTETVHMKVGISYQSIEQAARNLSAEIDGFDLEAVASAARDSWNRKLSIVEVEGGTESDKRVFYTALWRTFERMVDITEQDKYYGFDGKVHDANGVTYYTDDWTWDTWRAAHPLMTILQPKEEGDKLQSYVRMCEHNEEHWMPVFPGVAGDRHSMVNRHPSVMFLDAWRKGIRSFDAKKAFEYTDHTEETESLIPWYRGGLTELDVFYKKNGYYPGLNAGENEWVQGVENGWEKRQCVSVTQGASLDAWAIAEFGRELGIDSSRLVKYDERAKGYAKLWNDKTAFFHPRNKDGKFIEPFDYMYCGGFGARNYFTENNAWTYIWDVQHDLPGLVKLFGSKKAMSHKLDLMYNTSVGSRRHFIAENPDGCTGLMGVFSMANEPSFHIPYLYNYTDEPWKTQKIVRKTLECWFRDDRMGMCGDEDGGGMSAYAVFSMMGFYPVTPGLAEYQWGSPVFKKVVIHQQNGNDFVLEAPESTIDAKYIKSIAIDGKRTSGAMLPLKHSDILRGARVTVTMSDRP